MRRGIEIDDAAINRLQRQLDRVINDALYFLGRYSAQDLIDIIDFIEDELSSIEWDDSSYNDDIPLIERLRFIERVPDIIEIPVELKIKYPRDINAIFALFRAIEGKHYLVKDCNYVSAAESCTDAYEALYSILSIPVRDRIDRLSSRGKKGKQGGIDYANEDRKTIISEVEHILNKDLSEVTLNNIHSLDKKVTESLTFKFKKKNGSWHFSNIAKYIHTRLVVIPLDKDKNPILGLELNEITQTVTLYFKDQEKLQTILNYRLEPNR